MAVQGWRCWACLMLVLLTTSFSISDAFTVPVEEETYNESSLTEVMEINSGGTTRICVVPLNSNTRLKVLYTDTEGGTQEAVVRKKSLTENTLSILEIEVQPSGDSQSDLSVRINGTQLTIQTSNSLGTQQPRTTLLLKGQARIKLCPLAPVARGVEAPQDEEKQTTTQEGEGQQTTTRGKGEKMTPSSASSLPSSPTDAPSNATSEGTESGEEDPWWSFLLVLGTVGEVPVLALLVGGVLLGALLGGIVVCCCRKACRKCCRKYERVPTRPMTELKTQSKAPFMATNDFIRNPNDRSLDRSSGIGSASSTLTHDVAQNSVDRSIRSATHLSVNNLGRGTTGSPSGSTGRSHNNTLNIPTSASMTRYGSHRSTGSSDNRDAEISRTRTASSRSTGSSVNRNTNRSPNIPYTKTLGAITGHQDPSVIAKHHSGYSVGSVDSFSDDDDNYDKPYVSGPVVAENYSVPHTEVVALERPTNTNTTGNIPTNRQVPLPYATFGK